MLKLRKLNNKGFSHDFLGILFVVVFAIIGVGYLVASHADSVAYTSTNEFSKFQYSVGTGTTAALTHSNATNLLLQFNKGVTSYHASDTALYQFTLPAKTTASSLSMNVSYVDAGYDTVFVSTGTPGNRVWSVSRASTQSNQTVNLNFSNKPTIIYFGISAKGSSGGFSGSFPGNRNLTVNSYTLKGTTTTDTQAPTVSLSANPASVASGGSSTLTWSSTNATSCTASGGWSGAKATSGSVSTGALTASATYNLTCSGSSSTSASASTSVTVAGGGGGGGGGTGGQGGDGTLVFNGTFGNNLSNFPRRYGSCYTVDSASQLRMNITSACNPGGDGHYRVDICSSNNCDHDTTGAYYKAGVAMCTSIPIDLVNAPKVPSNSWFGFAQTKDYEAQTGGWWFGVRSDHAGYNQFQISFGSGVNTAWFGDIPSNPWNTLSICTNNGTGSSGVVYGIYLNGVKQTFTNGNGAGKQTISGVPIINDGAGSWPLSINDYTGGSPVPNEIIHGVPLIYTMGSNGLPPMPSGGWNSPN
jgi:hypothetical protein